MKSLREAYKEEVKFWDWSKIPQGMILAFVFCLDLRMQGTPFEELFKNDKPSDSQ